MALNDDKGGRDSQSSFAGSHWLQGLYDVHCHPLISG